MKSAAADWPGYLNDPHAPIPPTFLATVVYWESLSSVFGLPDARAAFDVQVPLRPRDLKLEEQLLLARAIVL